MSNAPYLEENRKLKLLLRYTNFSGCFSEKNRWLKSLKWHFSALYFDKFDLLKVQIREKATMYEL